MATGQFYFEPNTGNPEYYDTGTQPSGYYDDYSKYVADHTDQFKWTAEQKEVHITAQYSPIIRKLEEAWMAATMRGDTTNATAIVTEYNTQLAAMKKNIDVVLTPDSTDDGVFALPATTRCVECGYQMTLITFSDNSLGMQCPNCHHTEDADATNMTNTPGHNIPVNYCGPDLLPLGPGLGDGQ